jgi:hypothetical protein
MIRMLPLLSVKESRMPRSCSRMGKSIRRVAVISYHRFSAFHGNDLMGKNPVEVEAGFKNLKPGDIVGWKSATGSGHVAIYIGEGDKVFIDVKGENEKPRTVKSYGDQKLYKSDRK